LAFATRRRMGHSRVSCARDAITSGSPSRAEPGMGRAVGHRRLGTARMMQNDRAMATHNRSRRGVSAGDSAPGGAHRYDDDGRVALSVRGQMPWLNRLLVCAQKGYSTACQSRLASRFFR
jgi:hypothetical protein